MSEMMTSVIGLLIALIGLVTLVLRGQLKAQKPNGGKSQYDLLVRIEQRLDRLDWLRRRRRPNAAQGWGLRLMEDPALDARDAHPASTRTR